MPYRDWKSLAKEKCVFDWGKELAPGTALGYVYYFQKYLEWLKEKGYFNSAQELLEDCKKLSLEERYKHLDLIIEYISSLNTGTNDRKNRFQAVINSSKPFLKP